MLKRVFYLILLVVLANCGAKTNSPLGSGVDLPPDNNTPIGASSSSETTSSPEPALGVQVFDAPMVLVRGSTQQQPTEMAATPGS